MGMLPPELVNKLSGVEAPDEKLSALKDLSSRISGFSPDQQIDLLTLATACIDIGVLPKDRQKSDYAQALLVLGASGARLAQSSLALAYLLRSLEQFRQNQDARGELQACSWLGYVHLRLGHYASAMDSYTTALELARRLEYAELEAQALSGLGAVNAELEIFDVALSYFNASQRIYEEIGSKKGLAETLEQLSDIYRRQERMDDALRAARESLSLYEALELEQGRIKVMRVMGELLTARREPERALPVLFEALDLAVAGGLRYDEIRIRLALGDAYEQRGDITGALDTAVRALDTAEEIASRVQICECHTSLARYYRKTGDYLRALEHIDLCQALREQLLDDRVAARLRGLYVAHILPDGQTRLSGEGLDNIALKAELEEQLRRENILRESEARYRAVFETTGAATIIIREDTVIMLANSEFVRLTGYNKEEVEGKLSFTSLISPEDVRRLREYHYLRRSSRQGAPPQYEAHLIDKAGNIRNILVSVTLIPGSQDSVASFTDITPLKNAELALKAINDQLRWEILEREKLISDLDAFAHTVAHDLKNPLSQILGYAGLLSDLDIASLDEEGPLFLDSIVATGHKMANIINELLLLASVRQQDIKLSPIDSGRIIADVEKRLAYLIHDSRVEIEKPAVWPAAMGYETWIEEVWANYISNAIKYGGDPPKIALGADNLPEGMVRFWVSDNGEGITEEEIGRLFKNFGRLERMRTEGHGLGLAIVKRIVEKLGGTVGVTDVNGPDHGSRFWFTLPAVEQPEA